MLSVAVEVDGAIRKINTCALEASDLEKPMAIFGGYLKKKAKAVFEAQNLAPLADSTMKARAQRGLHKLEVKLQGDLRKASARASRTRAPRGLLAAILGAPGMTSAIEGETKGVKNRTAVLAAHQQLHVQRVSQKRKEGGFLRIVGAQKLTVKQQSSLAARAQRAVAKEVGGPILGKLPKTLHVIVEGSRMTLIEGTHEEWTDIHNRGGTAGHGAKMPKRETLPVSVDQKDLDVLIGILKDHVLAPLLEDGG